MHTLARWFPHGWRHFLFGGTSIGLDVSLLPILRPHLVHDVERRLRSSAKSTEPSRTHNLLDPTLACLSAKA